MPLYFIGLAFHSRCGQCCFESAVSSELLVRVLSAYPKMEKALENLGPKLLILGDGAQTEVDVRLKDGERLAERVEYAWRIRKG